MDSILTSIKKLLGIEEEYDHFDADLIMHINSVFMTLAQLGIGPSEGFAIEDESSTWEDFLSKEELIKLNAIKSFIHLSVRLLFDPPSASVCEHIEKRIAELTWRLNVAVEA